MRIAGVFSFNGGAEAVQRKYPHLLSDIENAISMVNAEDHRIKASREKTMRAVAFRDMDFVKERLGVEVQFGKYAFMVYNVCAKMTILQESRHH